MSNPKLKKRIPVFLHIGANKTGTSAIQRYCNTHRDTLAAAGMLYPRAGCAGEAHYHLSDALGFSHRRLTSEKRQALQGAIRDALAEELARGGIASIVFSSENFVLDGDPEAAARFFEGFDPYIVVYLRRHDSWWPSAFNQAVRQVARPKWGWGIEAFVAWQMQRHPRYGDWRHLLERWKAVFGKKRLRVRPYERQQNEPNVVADFFRTIGRADLAPQEAPVVNESLDAWSLRMVDIAQRADIDEASRRRIIGYTLRHPKGGPPLTAPGAYLRQLVARYADDYAHIAREFLGREDGQLFYDPLPTDDEHAPVELPAPREIMAWTVQALKQGEEN